MRAYSVIGEADAEVHVDGNHIVEVLSHVLKQLGACVGGAW